MNRNDKPKILFYDVETIPFQAWVFQCGKQVVSPKQLVKGHNTPDIICIGYMWSTDKKATSLIWDGKQNSKKMIKKFTKIAEKADVIIGKNNVRFDDKYVNTLRMVHDLAGNPEVMRKVDDLESQMRRNFKLPSNSLEYISTLLGLGGKNSMQLSDWIAIVQDKCPVALKKMVTYCQKDVVDTKKIWDYCMRHFKDLKLDHKRWSGKACCPSCGGLDIISNGYYTDCKGVKYRRLFCNSHRGTAGRVKL